MFALVFVSREVKLTLLSSFFTPSGIGWDWKQEEVHNLYSFERLRDPDRTHVARAIPSMARQALLVQYGLNEDEIREMIAEMRRKDKELLRGGSFSILPSFWPWKKVG